MYYIGLMAGTSFDGVDCALMDENNQLIQHHYVAYTPDTKADIRQVIEQKTTLQTLADLDGNLAEIFSQAANELIQKSGIEKSKITAIGSHGQTIYHAPRHYSWQIAHPAIIAEKTGITVVADFRMSDVAAGGEGAPLTPLYHQHLLQNIDGVVVNLGGITNITLLQNKQVIGFDVGPANILMDNWIQKHHNKIYDKNGQWAKSGQVIPTLLQTLLSDAYFNKPAPKSTGFEYFNLTWLMRHLSNNEAPEDVQATLLALTTHSIAKALPKKLPIYLCGGGTHNKTLVAQLKQLCKNPIHTTQILGMHPDYLEAAAFAFFAQQTLNKQPSNLPKVTHAKHQCILGGIYYSQ